MPVLFKHVLICLVDLRCLGSWILIQIWDYSPAVEVVGIKVSQVYKFFVLSIGIAIYRLRYTFTNSLLEHEKPVSVQSSSFFPVYFRAASHAIPVQKCAGFSLSIQEDISELFEDICEGQHICFQVSIIIAAQIFFVQHIPLDVRARGFSRIFALYTACYRTSPLRIEHLLCAQLSFLKLFPLIYSQG